MFFKRSIEMPSADEALPGREDAMEVPSSHFVSGRPLLPPYPDHLALAMYGMGCFWGAERKFWVMDGVYSTAVGYSGGHTPNPTYDEVCSGMTGHNEVVHVVFDPAVLGFEVLLAAFWESHDPTQGMRQGNDLGTQYRSGTYIFDDDQRELAERSRNHYQTALSGGGFGQITTEICQAGAFYFAEPYHQQYLAKNPGGYCGLGGTGVACSAGLASPAGA